MDDDDDYFDTLSVGSAANGRNRKLNKDYYLGLSRNTIYHSAVNLQDTMELTPLDAGGDSDDHGQNKRWRSFTNCDLCVDFVLAYDEQGKDGNIHKRNVFERNLENNGLILEREENQRIHFVKIHVPREILCQYSEILKLRLPIKDDETCVTSDNILVSTANKLLKCCNVTLDPKLFPVKKYQLTAEFSRDRNYLHSRSQEVEDFASTKNFQRASQALDNCADSSTYISNTMLLSDKRTIRSIGKQILGFDVDDPDFFNSSVRTTVASYILEREKFGDEDQDKGIKRLIAEDVYKAAYPLHDGDLHIAGSRRKLLHDEWASVSKWIKYQPIDEIKDYFGVKFALYFSWLGFYTHMLIPASIVGILCLIYGALTVKSDTLIRDICTKDITMCPRCDKVCDYWKLSESCTYTKIQHYIDNPATIFFAIFMSFWSTLYLELWKRYSAEVAHRWGLTGFDLQAEPPRPEYLIRLSKAKEQKLNIVTQLQEPVVPYWTVKLPSIIFSFTIAFFWTLIALAVVLGVVIYRMSYMTSDSLYRDQASYRVYIVPVTAGLINLVCIVILNYIYNIMAEWLTEKELQRTQTEFDDSLAVKIYMFQFVNYYSCIFYIAFLKGKFVGYPAKYNRIFGYRQEECNPGGCLMELTIQLAIIMIGNQAISGIIEMVVPLLTKMYKTFKVTTGIESADKDEITLISCNQWTEDYKLSEFTSCSLFAEYLEMVLQYGFVTIFVTAFPLAPLFALINNILEMRLDAKKFIKYYRRPVPQRVKNIGVWYSILAIVGRIAVVSNAFIIAFSSHFIPQLVYMMKVSKDNSDEGFLEHSLTKFNTSDFPSTSAPLFPSVNVSVCRYAEYRNPYDYPDPALKYKRPLIYWYILAVRLAFIVVYQNLVSFVMTVVQWTIPDVSRKLNDRIKREAYRTNETIIKHEMERLKRNRSVRKRDSVLSSMTIYHDANGDITPENQPTNNTVKTHNDT